ncbi:MAG: type II toxin-antitoxin system Phd/YefM family antitoxin [Longimicrobiales bacterium]
MRVVGIRQLKARLSEYLREVRRGEVFLVTDRDTVVAELRPPGSLHAPSDESTDSVLERLVDEGAVTPPRLDRAGWSWEPASLGMPDGTALHLLDELRSDRTGDGR